MEHGNKVAAEIALSSAAVARSGRSAKRRFARVLVLAPSLKFRKKLLYFWSHTGRHSRLVSHGLFLVIILAVVWTGSIHQGRSSSNPLAAKITASSEALGAANNQTGLTDQSHSVRIAAGVATAVDLPIASEIKQNAEDITAAATTSQSEGLTNKPQLINTAGGNKYSLQSYQVENADTVATIAQKFNLNVNTVRWANNLRAEAEPRVGQQLVILPVDGVLHTVTETDTPEGLALLYQSTAAQIVSFNDAEVEGLKPGQRIVIPNGVTVPAPGYRSLVANTGGADGSNYGPAYSANGYDYGWCTWHVANRRASAGRPIPSNWGNAISWRHQASASGFKVGNVPQAGAVAYQNNIGGWGHVGYVERLTADGAWFSDMNYPIWGVVTHRFVPAGEFGNYSFIY